MSPVSRIVTAFAAAALLALASGSAVAETDDEVKPAARAEFDKRMYGKEPAAKANTYACFVRRYDADHLARHPHQKVTSMKLLVSSEWFEGNTSLDQHFRLGVTFRNKRGAYDSSGSCSHFRPEEAKDEVRYGCGVDCDGGGINIAMGKDDNSVIVRLERVRIWQNNKPDEDASGELVAGKDDAIFRLDRAASLDECRSLVTDRKVLAAMRSVSNRK
jgi:hypothetical protein